MITSQPFPLYERGCRGNISSQSCMSLCDEATNGFKFRKTITQSDRACGNTLIQIIPFEVFDEKLTKRTVGGHFGDEFFICPAV